MITLQESRYARQELITWWDQDALSRARVLVVGAGALGNEIVKNLAMLGVGRIDIVDMDHIERSNLARTALFRESDEGQPKASVLARAAQDLNPEIEAVGHDVSVMALGLGFLAEFDLIIAGLDNREARLWIGQAARKLGKPWIDGAIEGLQGLARVFLADGACYECTLGEVDRKIMSARKSCALLSTDDMLGGKVPTNSTTASVVAAIEVQEAVKILVGREDLLALRNQALVFMGDTLETYPISYAEDEWCMSHDRYEELLEWPSGVPTIGDLIAHLGTAAPADTAVDFESELLLGRRCPSCEWHESEIRPMALLGRGDGECPDCGTVLALDAAKSVKGDDPLTQLAVAALRLPDREVITVRIGTERQHFIIEGEQ